MVEFAPLEFEPAYRKVATALLDRISDRTLSAGDRLPSELELARQFGVNRSTVREALRELESTGILRRHRGSKLMMVSRPEREAIAEGLSRALALHDVTIRDVWEGLTILEPPIAEAAARARRAADLAVLETTVCQALQRDPEAAARQAADFFRHVGEATARHLASRGARVFLGARRADRLAAIAAEIARAGGQAGARPVDVTTRAVTQSLRGIETLASPSHPSV